MTSHGAVRFAIFGIIALHSVFVCFSKPQIFPRSNDKETVSIETCPETCIPSKNVTCSDNCLCVLLGNAEEGTCLNMTGVEELR
ncbi:evasin P1126-like [Amblyomma americanum]